MFTDNLSKYQRLSPFFTGPFSSEAFYYPCLAGFYFSKLIYTLGNMVETLTATMAHKFIMIPKCQPRKVTCDKFNLDNYISNYSEFPKIIEEIQNRNKIILMERALEAKFEQDPNLQKILIANKSTNPQFIFTDTKDPIIGVGHDYKGQNRTGKMLEILRKYYLDKETEEGKLYEDIAMLTVLFKDNKDLITWVYSRATDIINVAIILNFGARDGPEISGTFISNIIKYFYSACDIKFDETIELEVPESFFIKLTDFFEQKFRQYTGLSMTNPMPVSLSHDAVIQVWRYVTFLTYTLMRESAKHKQKNINLFLNNIVQNLTKNTEPCPVKTSLKNTNTCIISAIQNILNNMIILFQRPIRANDLFIIPSIIIGNIVTINSSSEISEIFDDIFKENTYLKKYMVGSELPKIITGLNLIYDHVEKKAVDQYDVTQLENEKITNRINFFSSIPLPSIASIIPDSPKTISESEKQAKKQEEEQRKKQRDEKLWQLKVLADLPHDAPKHSRDLKLPAQRSRPYQPHDQPETQDTDIKQTEPSIYKRTQHIKPSIMSSREKADLEHILGDDIDDTLINELDEHHDLYHDDEGGDDEIIGYGSDGSDGYGSD